MEVDTSSYHYYSNNNNQNHHHHHQQQQQHEYDALYQRLSPSRTIVSSFTPYQQPVPTTNTNHNNNNIMRPEESFFSSYHHHQNKYTTTTTTNYNNNNNNNTTTTWLDQGDWALCLAQPSSSSRSTSSSSSSTSLASTSSTFACALSNGQVHVYDTERLHRVQTMAHHSSNYRNVPSTLITHLCYQTKSSHQLITTCAHDGSLRLFDIRDATTTTASSSSSSSSFGAPSVCGSLPAGQSAFHLDWGYDGTVLAVASTKGRIHFFDWRMSTTSTSTTSTTSTSSSANTGGMTLLGTYRESHVDDVTQVVFDSEDGKHLLTGSEDGLVGWYDTTQPTEALAVQSVCRVGAPIRKLGQCTGAWSSSSSSSSSSLVYCLTGSETVSLWNLDTATCVHDFGMSLRDDLSQRLALAGAASNAATTTQVTAAPQEPLYLEYLVDATWDAPSQQLFLTAGNAVGDAAIFRLATTPNPQNGQHSFTWQPRHYLTGGHRGVVRAAMHLNTYHPTDHHQILVTAGEDARLCEWKTNLLLPHPMRTMMTTDRTTLPISTTSSPNEMVTDTAGTTNGARSFSSCSLTSPSLTTMGAVGGGPIRRPRRQPNRPFAAPY